jgi:copper chaperone CopZ
MVKQTFLVPDMHCSNCVMKIEGLEDELPGVRRISASYHRGQVVVEYDETKIDPGAIVAAIKKKGYTVVQ